MAKTVETILQELSINSSSTVEEISNKIDEYILVTENEILGIKNISVQPLPTIVKNNETNLKQRMVGIVTDEERGTVALLNKRIVLLTRLINAIKSEANSKEQILLEKIEQLKTETTSSINALQSQINTSNVAFNNRITNVENKVKKYFDLGEITQSPTIQNNTKLNSIKENGIYTFSYNKQQYFMMVSDVFADGSDIVYTILKQGQEELYVIIRELVNHSMYITEQVVATLEDLKGKADSAYVEEMFDILHDDIFNNAEEITAIKNNIKSINIVKADKTEIPVNLSQLKNDTNFITDTVSNLKNYYNKNEVKELIGKASSLKFEVVTTLPTSNISSSTIYLKKIGTEGTNIYEEYLYVNNRWEMIGNTSVDLSNYVQKDELIPIVTENSKEAFELELKEVESEYEIVETNKYLTPNDRQVPTTSVVDKMIKNSINNTITTVLEGDY